MNCRPITRAICCLGLPILLLAPDDASAQQVRITKLTDVAFGTIANFSIDQTSSQSICVYSTGTSGRYRVTATGSGTGGAFTLAAGSARLPYEVQWAATPNQTTGTSLTAGVALTGLTTNATRNRCNNGPPTTASLITILRTTEVSAASSGTYSGTLTLLVSPN